MSFVNVDASKHDRYVTLAVFDFALQRKCTYFHDVLTGSRDKVQKLNNWLD